MPDWIIYAFIVVLLLSIGVLIRVCFVQGREARRMSDKMPGILGFTLLVTGATLAVDIPRHGTDYLFDNPMMIASRFMIVLMIQLVPYMVGFLIGGGGQDNGVIGMD